MPTTLTMPADANATPGRGNPNLSLHNPSDDTQAANEAVGMLEDGDGDEDGGQEEAAEDATEIEAEAEAETASDAAPEVAAEATPEAAPEPTATVAEVCLKIAEAANSAAHDANADTLTEIARAEMICDARESVVNELREELKNAKKEYDGAVIALRKLCRAVKLDSNRPLFSAQVVSSPGVAAVDADDVSPPPAVDVPTVDPDAWKTCPLSELGLKSALAAKLAENGINTIGNLEDLRADIANSRAVWPKGIGAAKITQIEDAVVGWLTANRDKDLFGQVVAEGEAEPKQAEAESAESASSDELDPDAEAACARSVELDSDNLDDLQSQHQEGTRWWEEGQDGFEGGLLISDCPYRAGECQDDWLRGWLFAGKNDTASGVTGEEQEPELAEAATASTLVDDINDL